MPKIQKWLIFGNLEKPEACAHTGFPDRSLLIGHKLVENAKIEKKMRLFWVIFKHCGALEFWKPCTIGEK